MTERYPTPDKLLTLLIQRDETDISIGFDGLQWHIHADIIANLRNEKDNAKALQHYLDDIFHDRLPIIILKKGNKIIDAWIPDFPDEPISTKYNEADEATEIRTWNNAKQSHRD